MEEYSDRTPADIARLPMVPIRDVVIFPFTKVAFKIGRPGSIRALEEALQSDRTIFLATQHDASIDEPLPAQKRVKEFVITSEMVERRRAMPGEALTGVDDAAA